jgi:hypothetical protein
MKLCVADRVMQSSSRSACATPHAHILLCCPLLPCAPGAALPAATRHQTERPEPHCMPATAPAGQVHQQQRSPSPPPFRAGFSYERAQTPEIHSKPKEQQRLARHKAFTATQPSLKKHHKHKHHHQHELLLATSPAADRQAEAAATRGQESMPAQAASSTENSRKVTPPARAAAVGANPNDGSTHAFSNNGSSTALQQQLPQPMQQQQQQKPQQKPVSRISSARDSTGVSHTLPRRTNCSNSGDVAVGPCQVSEHANASSPIVASQGLLHAMAYGYGKQALDRCVCMASLYVTCSSRSLSAPGRGLGALGSRAMQPPDTAEMMVQYARIATNSSSSCQVIGWGGGYSCRVIRRGCYASTTRRHWTGLQVASTTRCSCCCCCNCCYCSMFLVFVAAALCQKAWPCCQKINMQQQQVTVTPPLVSAASNAASPESTGV